MRRIGCLTPLGLVAGLVAMLSLTGAALTTGGMMFNPGPLYAMGRNGLRLSGVTSHAEIGGRCAACHTPPRGGEKMEGRCLACHTNIQAQTRDSNTLHGALPEGLLCRSCHTEHKGPQAALTRVDFKNFPHDVLGFSLTTHRAMSTSQPFACADCHVQDLAHFDRTLCETCHRNYQADFITAHIANFGNDCVSCHNGMDRFSKNQFDHSTFTFALVGKHTAVLCTLCHTNVHTLADFKNAPQQCVDCHRKDDAHKGVLGADCAKCHTPDDWKKVTYDHNLSVFKLTGKHVDIECAECHVNNVFKGISQQCVDCHRKDDPHNGTLGADCAKCHTAEGWKNVRFDHNLSVFKLTGKHVDVECTKCHVNKVFKGTTQKCIDCHRKDDPHQGALGECAKCHTPEDWKRTTFDHNRSVFKLTGQHTNVTCAKCHTDKIYKRTLQACVDCHRQDDAHQGALGTQCVRCHTPAGWKPSMFDHNQSVFKLIGRHTNAACARCHTDKLFKGTLQACVDCHRKDDAHQGQFGANCAQCHTPAGWKPATFDHNRAAFKLTGAHVNVACTQCHANGVFKGTPQNCVDCHHKNDAHNGAFGANCAQCHTTEGWEPATFDHDRAAFKLTGAHVSVACARCHVSNVFQGTPQTCVSCHAEPAVHRGQFGTDCTQCHNTDSWQGATFNHAFPLNHGGRGTIPCVTCHTTPGDFGGYTCYGCHNQAEIEQKHREEGATNLGDCVRCHSTGGGDD